MSEIKQINTGVAELLAILLPEGASDFTTISKYLYFHHLSSVYSSIELPPGNWKILGISTELTEEQCREILPYSVLTEMLDMYRTVWFMFLGANGLNEPRLILIPQ